MIFMILAALSAIALLILEYIGVGRISFTSVLAVFALAGLFLIDRFLPRGKFIAEFAHFVIYVTFVVYYATWYLTLLGDTIFKAPFFRTASI